MCIARASLRPDYRLPEARQVPDPGTPEGVPLTCSAFIGVYLRIDCRTPPLCSPRDHVALPSSLRRFVAALRASFPVPLGLPLTHGWVKGPARSAGRKKCPLFHAPMIDAHLLHLVHLLATSARPRLRIHRVRTPKAFPLRAPRLGVPEPESRIPACSLSPQSWNGHFSRHSAWRSALSLEVFSPFSPLSVFPFEPECSASPAREDSADAPAEDWAGSSNPRSATLDTR